MKRRILIVLACLLSIAVLPSITTQAQTSGLNWFVEYFPNKNLEGAPALTRTMSVAGSAWTTSSPDAGFPPNTFSARWTAAGIFQAGIYRFALAGSDGLRLYVDNALLINQWRDQPFTTYSADVPLTAGNHTLRVEHYASSNLAVVQFNATRLTADVVGVPQLPQFGIYSTQAKLLAFMRLRLGPGIGYGYIHVLDWGTVVDVTARTADGKWLKVNSGDKEGWVARSYARIIGGSLKTVPIWIAP